MWLIPAEHTDMTSPLALDAAFEAMSSNVEPVRLFRWQLRLGFWNWADKNRDFEGERTGDTFAVRRIAGRQTYFSPRASITLSRLNNGTRVSIDWRIDPTALLAFLAFWTMLLIWVQVSYVRYLAPIVLGFSLFSYAVLLGTFWYEVKIQRPMFRAIFQTTES